jgi:hypothetical protein
VVGDVVLIIRRRQTTGTRETSDRLQAADSEHERADIRQGRADRQQATDSRQGIQLTIGRGCSSYYWQKADCRIQTGKSRQTADSRQKIADRTYRW